MENSQSRFSNRGALIAVIKIQINPQRTNSIYLHQNDDDYRLAQDFVDKCQLNHNIINFIYQKIKVTRASLEVNDSRVQSIQPAPSPFSYEQNIQKSCRKNINPPPITNKYQDIYEEEQSFGNLNQISKFFQKNSNYTGCQPQLEDQIFSCTKVDKLEGFARVADSPKKKRDFIFYDSEQNQQDSCIDINLFAQEKINNKNTSVKTQVITGKTVIEHLQSQQSEFKSKISQVPDTREYTSHLQVSQSASKFNFMDTRNQRNPLIDTRNIRVSSDRTTNNQYDKPTHVKIIRKDQMISLNQSLKRSMSKQEISKINKDVTRRLYNEADIKKNYLNIIKEKARKNKQQIQDKQLTHKPELNRISKKIAEGRKKLDTPVQMYLMEEGKKIQAKKNQYANIQNLKQIQNCSFQPIINIISQKLVADKSKLCSRISENKCRKSHVRDQNMFRPSLNKVTNQLMKDKGSFQERQRQYLEQKNTKLIELVKQRQANQKIDQQSGQELFKPKIHDIGVRQNQGTNIGNYLFELSKQNQSCTQDNKDYRPKINEQSEYLVQQMYSKRIGWLFSQLDSDQDGIISAQKISIENISVDILGIIKPILFQMQEMGEQLSLIDFKNAIEILHRKLNTFEKIILYNYKQKVIK